VVEHHRYPIAHEISSDEQRDLLAWLETLRDEGYRLSKVFFELKTLEQIGELVADPAVARARYGLTDEEIVLLQARDRTQLLAAGVNPYLIRLVYRDQTTFNVERVAP